MIEVGSRRWAAMMRLDDVPVDRQTLEEMEIGVIASLVDQNPFCTAGRRSVPESSLVGPFHRHSGGRAFKQPAVIPIYPGIVGLAELVEGRLHRWSACRSASGSRHRSPPYHNEERLFTSQDVRAQALAAQAAVSISNV